MEKVCRGVYQMKFGIPEKYSYISFREYPVQETVVDAPALFDEADVAFRQTARGCELVFPQRGHIFGLGLQLTTTEHTEQKRTLRCNADPQARNGESHAPVPFFVSTAGYGVLVDSARDISFYFGQCHKIDEEKQQTKQEEWQAQSTFAAYEGNQNGANAKTRVEIPVAKGVHVYLFMGDSMMDVVQKYVMFCGGGAAMPEWGLGPWYRIYGGATAAEWLLMAERFKQDDMPITVLGLEPGWQTHAYSCSLIYDTQRLGDCQAALDRMHELGYRINLWEHCYTHPTSPLYDQLLPYAGDHTVWGGLVPDFTCPEARTIWQEHHKTLHADCFKLDECDGSDLTGGWSYPDGALFPSGLDGEQMHHLLGLLYQQTIYQAFPESCHSVRASGSMAAPYPFVLYSDLYDHRDFVRGVVNAGFSGLLWAPEVRDAVNLTDFIRRLQTALFSPQMLINAWYLKNPPWDQLNTEKNMADEYMEEAGVARDMVRDLLKKRMEIVPYLKRMYDQYAQTGKPVFRALILDYPQDETCLAVDDEYLMGDDYLFAPLTAQNNTRKVYLPGSDWIHNGLRYPAGWHTFTCGLTEYLLFEKG